MKTSKVPIWQYPLILVVIFYLVFFTYNILFVPSMEMNLYVFCLLLLFISISVFNNNDFFISVLFFTVVECQEYFRQNL